MASPMRLVADSSWQYGGVLANDLSCSGAPGIQADAWVAHLANYSVARTGDSTANVILAGTTVANLQCLNAAEAQGIVDAFAAWTGEIVALRVNDLRASGGNRNTGQVTAIAVGADTTTINVTTVETWGSAGTVTGWGLGGRLASLLGGSNTSPSYKLWASKTAGTTASDADQKHWIVGFAPTHIESPFTGKVKIYTRGNSTNANPGLMPLASITSYDDGVTSYPPSRLQLTVNCANAEQMISDVTTDTASGFTIAGIDLIKSSATATVDCYLKFDSRINLQDIRTRLTGTTAPTYGIWLTKGQGSEIRGCAIGDFTSYGIYTYGAGNIMRSNLIKGGTWGIYADAVVSFDMSENQIAGQSTGCIFVNGADTSVNNAPTRICNNVLADSPIGIKFNSLVAAQGVFNHMKVQNNVMERCVLGITDEATHSLTTAKMREYSMQIQGNSIASATTPYFSAATGVARCCQNKASGVGTLDLGTGFRLPATFATAGFGRLPLGTAILAGGDRSCR